MAVTAASLTAVDTLFKALFTKAFSKAQSRYKLVCMIIPSTAAENVYGWLAALPMVGKVIGEYGRKRLQRLGYRLSNEKFGGIVEVKEEDFEDDQLGTYAPSISSWGERASYVPDTELTAVMVDGFTAAGKDYTGSAFFGAGKKAFPKSKFPFTNFTPKKLSVANFEAGLANLLERTDAEGAPLYLGLDPSKLLLVVCSDDRALADTIVSKTLAGGADNPNFNKATVVVWPGLQTKARAVLADADALPWMLLDCSKEVKPFIFQERTKFSIVSMIQQTAQQVFDEDVYSWKVKGRLAVGYGLPELAYGSSGIDAA